MNKTSGNILELFAGTKSIGKAANELGYNVFSSDIGEQFNTDYTTDLLLFDYNKVPFQPDVIWASPPCTSFSIASMNYHWDKDRNPLTEEAILGYQLVEKTIEIINHYNPTYWYIENPRGLLRHFPIMNSLPIRNTVTYSQYGDTRNKPTDIWTNNEKWIPKPFKFHNVTPDKKYQISSVERSMIPHNLCLEILSNS